MSASLVEYIRRLRRSGNSGIGRWLVDWVLLGLLTLLLVGVLHKRRDGFHQQFTLEDPDIQHPYAKFERVPGPLLISASTGLPLFVIVFVALPFRRRWARLNAGVLGLLLALVITASITDFVKNLVGRPRPDMLARCKPQGMDMISSHKLVDSSICTTPASSSRLANGFKSFPSGHSSLSFAGLVYLALFLHCALCHMVVRFATQAYALYEEAPREDAAEALEDIGGDDRKESEAPRYLVASAVVVPLLPIMLAVYIALSRLMDYRHHPTDVLAGSVLGTVVASTIFFVYHPRGAM